MATNCECIGSGPNKGPLAGLEGDEIVGVEIINGGDKFCNAIELKLKSGRILCIERYLNVSKYGITPRLEYRIGHWLEIDTSKETNGS